MGWSTTAFFIHDRTRPCTELVVVPFPRKTSFSSFPCISTDGNRCHGTAFGPASATGFLSASGFISVRCPKPVDIRTRSPAMFHFQNSPKHQWIGWLFMRSGAVSMILDEVTSRGRQPRPPMIIMVTVLSSVLAELPKVHLLQQPFPSLHGDTL